MACRFTADNCSLASTALPNHAVWTWCAWVKLSTDRNTFQCVIDIVDGAGEFYFETTSDGVTWSFNNGVSVTTMSAAQVGAWYFLAMRKNGAALGSPLDGLMSGPDGRGALVKTSATTGVTSTGTTNLRIGKEEFNASTFPDGCISYFKLWEAALTDDELLAEMWQGMPMRTKDLWAFWPMITPREANLDFGPTRGRHLTFGTTALILEQGPPVGWA